MTTACFALLDDASAADPHNARSRLYTGHAGTLTCSDTAQWPAMLEQMQQATQGGLHAVVVLTYELGAQLLAIRAPAQTPIQTPPLAQVLLFSDCAHLTPPEVASWLAARADAGQTSAGIAAVRANVDEPAFSAAIGRIRDYIAAGDTYQVNYTYRLRFDAFGSIEALYARLRARQPVPYGALIALPDGGAVLSLSPELFVRHHNGELLTRPMKGTAPANTDGADAGADADNAERARALAADPKNRAENLMIVDLLRNDLGRVAATGSVQVPALFDVQRYSGVLQMTSTVRATVRRGVTLAQLFEALYPCGSITGAPKRRTMEIIAELEPDPRGIYTGAIGWFDPPATPQPIGAHPVGDFCLSVPIRTLTLQAPQDDASNVRRGEMGVGAGIVYDSDAASEYAECQLKARFLTGLTNPFELFETMRADAAQGCAQRERHLARLAQSTRYFGFPFDAGKATATLDEYCASLGDGPHRLRLAVGSDGNLSVSSAPLTPLAQPARVLIAPDATRSGDLFLRHKTSVRARYDAAWRDAEAQGAFDMLFFNERGELTEGGRTNVFIHYQGRWITPPLACGLLPGVMRAAVLDDPAWQASEAVVTRPMLAAASQIMICNALRGTMMATLVVAV